MNLNIITQIDIIRNIRSRNLRGRYGLSLIEIMMSILVLSIGLLGVLAAIPFGGFQMEQMRNADYTASVARNAFAIIEANDWHVPSCRSWYRPDLERYNNNNAILFNNTSNYCMDFTFPVLIDPIGEQLDNADGLDNDNTSNYPYPVKNAWNNIFYYYQIYPRKTNFDLNEGAYYNNTGTNNYLNYFLSRFGIDYYFRTHDDIVYNTPEHEGKTIFRPVLTDDELVSMDHYSDTNRYDNVLTENLRLFTGEFSWMAMVRPRLTDISFRYCPVYPTNSVQETDVDVIVFKGRTTSKPLLFTAYKMDNMVGGGSFFLTLTNSENDSLDDLYEYLKTTSHILITGNNPLDFTVENNTNYYYRRFARWYQVANYSRAYTDNTFGYGIQVTLIGPDCPNVANWGTVANGSVPVKALVFPQVTGVYSRTMSIKKK